MPTTLDDALAARAAHPEAVVVAGGTGVMVLRNADPSQRDVPLLDLSGVRTLRASVGQEDVVTLGAGVTYSQVIEQLAGDLPDLALAARTIAGRQIRNRATVAGALALADPSSDALAALGAADATVDLRAAGDRARRVRAVDFVRGPGDADLRPDELVAALHVPRPMGPVAYAKVGARNAMARAVCGACVRIDAATGDARVCVVGVARQALVLDVPAGSQDPVIDVDAIADSRAGAEYRRHAANVLTRRALARARGELAAWN